MKNNNIYKEKALKIFEFAARNVPAYKKLLAEYGINPKIIIKNRDFEGIPIIDKKNYLLAFPPLQLVPKGKYPPMLSASSGSSGKPFYWPRGDAQEASGAEIHRIILENIFKLKGKTVLAIVCFSMGNWIAGTFTLASLREVARKDKHFKLTTITPGIDKEDAVGALRDLAPYFDSVVVLGYPPFIMDVILAARELGVNLEKLDLYFILAGENFSEKWRSMLLKTAGAAQALNKVVSIYGTADAGALGHENPFTVTLRRLASKHKDLKKDLFGQSAFLPTVVAYYPEGAFFEAVNGNLILTTSAGIPLVRYDIKDHGMLLSHQYVISLLKKHKLYKILPAYLKNWRQPMAVLQGRQDVAVTFYAVNIYPENIKAGLEDDRVAGLVTGKYVIVAEQTENLREQKLKVAVELKKGINTNTDLVKIITSSLFDNLIELNTEYRKLSRSINQKAMPEVSLVEYGHEQFIIKKSKHRWVRQT